MPLLVLSGIPGSGKSTYARHLSTRGWDWINHDKLPLSKGPLVPVWIRIFQVPPVDAARVKTFVDAVGDSRVVVEFGFPIAWLGVVAELKRLGASAWWFDGDRAGCLASWKEEWQGTQPETNWHNQVNSISSNRHAVDAVFEPNVLRARLPDRHLTVEEIDAAVRNSSRDQH